MSTLVGNVVAECPTGEHAGFNALRTNTGLCIASHVVQFVICRKFRRVGHDNNTEWEKKPTICHAENTILITRTTLHSECYSRQNLAYMSDTNNTSN